MESFYIPIMVKDLTILTTLTNLDSVQEVQLSRDTTWNNFFTGKIFYNTETLEEQSNVVSQLYALASVPNSSFGFDTFHNERLEWTKTNKLQ